MCGDMADKQSEILCSAHKKAFQLIIKTNLTSAGGGRGDNIRTLANKWGGLYVLEDLLEHFLKD